MGFQRLGDNVDCHVVEFLRINGITDEATIKNVLAAKGDPAKVRLALEESIRVNQFKMQGLVDGVVTQAKLPAPIKTFVHDGGFGLIHVEVDGSHAVLRVDNIDDAKLVLQAIREAQANGAKSGTMFTGEIVNPRLAAKGEGGKGGRRGGRGKE